MSYKTLILIDNSSTVTTLNREIIKETVKYLIVNGDSNTKFCVATVSNGMDILADYDDTKDTKVRSVEKLEYRENVDSSFDTIMQTVQKYRDGDLAERDIILISDGHREDGSYTAEELFFELNDASYPVYVLCCDQNDNKSELRELSSVARISGGKAFHTMIEGNDASVGSAIGNEILTSLSEKHSLMEQDEGYDSSEQYKSYADEYENIEYSSENYVNQNNMNYSNDDKIMVENGYLMDGGYSAESNVVYEYPTDYKASSGKAAILLPVCIIIIFIISLFVISNQRKKRIERKKEELFMNSLRASIEQKSVNEGVPKEIIDEMNEGETRSLNFDEYVEEEGGTRLLYQAADGVDITLEDRADPTKYFRAQVRDRIVIGRSQKLCDIPINYDDSVSSRHCELFLRCEELFVRDLSSSNGTYVNGQKVYQEIKVNSGDILKLGQLSLYIQVRRCGFS